MALATENKLLVVELSPLERGWLKQCIGTQAAALRRSRQKEISGGEIWVLRGKELETLAALSGKF